MERRRSIVCGMLGAVALAFTDYLKILLPGGMHGFVTSFITGLLSTAGVLFLVYFSILLILDALKELRR